MKSGDAVLLDVLPEHVDGLRSKVRIALHNDFIMNDYHICLLLMSVFIICAGIDHLLAQHIAHLFIRDPVSVFAEKINLDDSVDTDHFEV